MTSCHLSDGTDLAAAYLSDPYACPGYRLPTEAEWKYSARAPEDTTYSGSNTIDDVTNAWGLHDMSGNVWKWRNDGHDESYGGYGGYGSYGGYESYGSGAASSDPIGPASGSCWVFRGCQGLGAHLGTSGIPCCPGTIVLK